MLEDRMLLWNQEKSEKTIINLSKIIEIIRKSNLDESTIDDIDFYMYPLIYDLTKIISYACHAEWNPDDRKYILKGELGAKYILCKYKINDFSDYIKPKIDSLKVVNYLISDFLNVFYNILQSNDRSERTLLFEKILYFKNRKDIKISFLSSLELSLEKVTNNEMNWEDFKNFCKEFPVKNLEDINRQTQENLDFLNTLNAKLLVFNQLTWEEFEKIENILE